MSVKLVVLFFFICQKRNSVAAELESSRCEFCGQTPKPFPSVEEQSMLPPEKLFCCSEYREHVTTTPHRRHQPQQTTAEVDHYKSVGGHYIVCIVFRRETQSLFLINIRVQSVCVSVCVCVCVTRRSWFFLCDGSPQWGIPKNVKIVPVILTVTWKMRSKYRGHDILIDHLRHFLSQNQNVWCSGNTLPMNGLTSNSQGWHGHLIWHWNFFWLVSPSRSCPTYWRSKSRHFKFQLRGWR